jgi:hypothetical protein
MLKILTAITAGIAAHQSNAIFEQLESHTAVAWPRMSRYGFGYLCCIPIAGLIAPPEYRRVVMEAMLAAGVAFGFGVACGYLVDYLLEEK